MLSAIVLTKNEEKNIEECLKCLDFCDELVIVDDFSDDKTLSVCRKFSENIFQRKLTSFSNQRNFGMEKANNEWALFLDADELIKKKLREEILRVVNEGIYDGFFIERQDYFLGRKMRYGDLKNVHLLRLSKKNVSKWSGDVHERLEVKGRVGKLSNPIIHKSHESLADFIFKINTYSTIRANELKKNGHKSSFIDIIFYPPAKFVNLYILKMGFRDGLSGFLHAVFMSFYSFLVRGKLYQNNNK